MRITKMIGHRLFYIKFDLLVVFKSRFGINKMRLRIDFS